MLKMFHKQDHAGNTPDFWEENWEAAEFERAVSFCAVDPLRPLFEEYLRPDSLILEGGCGIGNYASYYAARGFRVVGLDFAQRALSALKTRQPHLNLCGGDVSSLPFADKTFDLYYSGGVVEHFEDGPDASLLEARRVLKDDGVLLISVPYYNPLRRLLAPFRKGEWLRVDRSEAGPNLEQGRNFFQYAYTVDEFRRILSNAGLETIGTQGYAVLWGIQELPFLNRNGGGEFSAGQDRGQPKEPAFVDVGGLLVDRPASLIKRLAVSEDDTVPVLGLGVELLRWSVGNMMMYVCRRK